MHPVTEYPKSKLESNDNTVIGVTKYPKCNV